MSGPDDGRDSRGEVGIEGNDKVYRAQTEYFSTESAIFITSEHRLPREQM